MWDNTTLWRLKIMQFLWENIIIVEPFSDSIHMQYSDIADALLGTVQTFYWDESHDNMNKIKMFLLCQFTLE
jgi:hypothetical protein